MTDRLRTARKSALLTVATLFGSILVGIGLGHVVFTSMPGHSMLDPAPGHMIVAALPLLLGLLVGGILWGRAMGRVASSVEPRRMEVAGVLGFVPITLFMAFGLLWLESIAIENFGRTVPIHRVFTLLFVPTAFLIAAISAGALGVGLRDRGLAIALFWKAGLAAGLAFLVVNMVMEAAGWVVGAPGAAERATMIVVMSLGNLAAALAGGAVVGWLLAPARKVIESQRA